MVQNKSHHVNYTYSLFVSVYVVQVSTLQLLKIKYAEIIKLCLNRDDMMRIIKILPVLFYSTNDDTILTAHMNLVFSLLRLKL